MPGTAWERGAGAGGRSELTLELIGKTLLEVSILVVSHSLLSSSTGEALRLKKKENLFIGNKEYVYTRTPNSIKTKGRTIFTL